MSFVGIVLLCHEAIVVFDVLKCLAGESSETNKILLLPNANILLGV